MARKKLQMVWPKDGPKGGESRGFFGGLKDIFGGTGPDMFVQRAGSREAITIGEWSNWDSYNNPALANYNAASAGPFKDRGAERYDPYTRKYTTWADVSNPYGQKSSYPRFTQDEMKLIRPRMNKNKLPKPSEMGSDWTHFGPKRFRPEHNYFWQNAHRVNNNYLDNLPWYADVDPWFQMGQHQREDLRRYARLYI